MNEMRCPRCECPEFSIHSYDRGMDRETGYMNAGTIGKCGRCGLEADIEDFQPIETWLTKNTKVRIKTA